MKKKHLALVIGSAVSLTAIAAACGNSDSSGGNGAPDAAADANNTSNDGATSPSDAGADGPVLDASTGLCTDYNPLKNPYFGDLHSHTSYSFDAYSFDTRNTPPDAYAFARGETLQVAGAGPDGGGPMTTIERPLDFLALTDHSEWLALSYGCGDQVDGGAWDPTSPYYDAGQCEEFRSVDPTTQSTVFTTSRQLQADLCDGGAAACDSVVRSAWQSIQQAATAANVPCTFTSFMAYEWTHEAAGATLHKNVIFGTDKVPTEPVDSFNYPTQASLWTALDTACTAANGCSVITIPHNSNLSQGGAFVVPAGSEAEMQKYQRLVEIFQHKGGSECFYDANDATTDPTCKFEYLGGVTEPNLPASYVRNGLKTGLTQYASSTAKINPLQMGIIAATDDHNGAPGNVKESTWPGHLGRTDDSPAARIGPTNDNDGGPPAVSAGHNPGGVAVAWAEQNTRDAIFAAFQRRETYGTSGTRIVVRFYQTWDTVNDPCADPNFPAQIIANGGVPMGGTFTLPSNTDAGVDGGPVAPRLVAYAWKDKVDLARVDIIKAWIDANGVVQEVNTKNPVVAGKPACFVLDDTSFIASPTFYYARVLETPVPRWSSYDCATGANPAACADGGGLDVNIQERAWTSPIWYLP